MKPRRASVSVRHNFETGHRLPHLGGKCSSLHGHSWWLEVELEGELDPFSGIVAEYGQLKGLIRGWVDEHLDHGVMLSPSDPLLPILRRYGKVYELEPWPTVETVARHLAEVVQDLMDSAKISVKVIRTKVTETHVNAAEFRP